jgi:cyclic pyranopterin phosphate synthase
VRKGLMTLIGNHGRHLKTGALEELTLTTNGNSACPVRGQLADAGVRRINVRWDTLKPRSLPHADPVAADIAKVISGIDAAQAAGMRREGERRGAVGRQRRRTADLIRWAHGPRAGVTLIEGPCRWARVEADRTDQYLSRQRSVRAGELLGR